MKPGKTLWLFAILSFGCYQDNLLLDSEYSRGTFMYAVLFERSSSETSFYPIDTVYATQVDFQFILQYGVYPKEDLFSFLLYDDGQLVKIGRYHESQTIVEYCPGFGNYCYNWRSYSDNRSNVIHSGSFESEEAGESLRVLDFFPYSRENLGLTDDQWVWNVYDWELIN